MAGCSSRIFLLICISLQGSIVGDKLALEYRILEEQPAHTTIGNVAADVGLDNLYAEDELFNMRYHLVAVVWNQPLSNNDEELSYFTLDADSGLLTTSKAILSHEYF